MATLDTTQIATELESVFQAGLKNIAVADAGAAQALYTQYTPQFASLYAQQAQGNPNVTKDIEDLQAQFVADLGAIGIQDQAIAEKQLGTFFGTLNQLAIVWLGRLAVVAATA